jgi:hypothetical protein
MFGNKKRLTENLSERDGTEAWATVVQSDPTGGNLAGANVQRRNRAMKVKIEPEGQQPFEVAFHQTFEHTTWPGGGQRVKVIYDPNDHSKVAILEDQPYLMPGQSPEQAKSREAKLAELRAAAKNGTLAAHTEQVQAESKAQPNATASIADELAKLADLRDRGVLDDAEFEVQKAKLLSAD